jgi:hypothetical protein
MEHTTCQTVFASACTRCHENSTGHAPVWQKPLFLGLGTRVRDCAGNSRHPCIARKAWSARHHGARVTLLRPRRPASASRDSVTRPKRSAVIKLACEFGSPKSAACGSPLRRAYRAQRSCGRVAEGGGLLNRYRVVKPYRGFESLRLRHPSP